MVMITNSFDKFPNEPTGLMYEQFGKIGLNPATTVTYETDFSASTGWTTSNSSKVDISTSNNELQVKENGGSLAQMYYDLGASVSTTEWVIRCRMLVNGSANTDEVLFKFELNDTANASSNTNSDALGFYVYTDRNNGWSRIYSVCKDSTTSVQGLAASPTYYGNISSGTYYYLTLTRSSATDYKVEIRTGSHTGAIVSGGTLTQSSVPSGITGLRYLTAQNYLQGQGQTMDISELEFYNGASSVASATWNIEHGMVVWTAGIFDFSSSAGWTKSPSNTSYWSIASNKLSWDCRIASTGQGYNYDLTTGQSVSNLDSYDEWLLRFEIVVTGGTNLNNDCVTTFGISSKDDFTSGTGAQYTSSRSQIRLQCAVLDPNGNTRTLQMQAQVGTHMGQQTTPNVAFSNNTIYYVEIKKTGATSYTVSWTANSDYVTATNSKNFTGLTLTGLKYLHMESWLQNTQPQYESRSDGYIDNLKFYAGVSSI